MVFITSTKFHFKIVCIHLFFNNFSEILWESLNINNLSWNILEYKMLNQQQWITNCQFTVNGISIYCKVLLVLEQ